MSDPRGVAALSNAPPPLVVLDTSAVVCALLEDQAQHEEYASFLARAVASSTTLVYCDLLDLELAETCMTIALKRQYGRRWRDHRGDRAALGPARDLMHEVFSRWREAMAQTSSARLPLGPIDGEASGSPVRDRAFFLLERYPIRSYDAAHAGAAILVGAPLVCRDVGFASVPEDVLTIVTDSTRVARCRAVRLEATL